MCVNCAVLSYIDVFQALHFTNFVYLVQFLANHNSQALFVCSKVATQRALFVCSKVATQRNFLY